MSSQITTSGPATNLPAESKSAKLDQYVANQVERAAARVRWIEIATHLALVATVFLGALLTFCIVDAWIVSFSPLFRLLALAALILSGLAYGIWRTLPLLIHKINPIYAAKMIEDAKPGLKNSLLNYMTLRTSQTADESAKPVQRSVMQMLQNRAANDISQTPIENTVDQTNLIRIGFVLVAILLLSGAYKLFSPKDPFQSLARLAAPLAEISTPSRVRIQSVEPGDVEIFFGDSIDIVAQVKGLSNSDDVMVVYSSTNGEIENAILPLESDESRREFRARLETDQGSIQQSLRYYVIAGDTKSNVYEIKVSPRPTLSVEKLELTPPRYTQLPKRVLNRKVEVSGLEGTRVHVEALANLKMERAWIELVAAKSEAPSSYKVIEEIPMEVDDRLATGEFVLRMINRRIDGKKIRQPLFTHYRLMFISAEGKRTESAIPYPVEIQPDLAPEIVVLTPANRESEIPENRVLPIEVEASDPDFQIRGIELTISFSGNKIVQKTLDLGEQDRRGRVQAGFDFLPRKYSLKPGSQVLLTVIALDNRCAPKNELPDPNRTRSENYLITILPPVVDPNGGSGGDSDPENKDPENKEDDNKDEGKDDQKGDKGSSGNDGEDSGDKKDDSKSDGGEKGDSKDGSGKSEDPSNKDDGKSGDSKKSEKDEGKSDDQNKKNSDGKSQSDEKGDSKDSSQQKGDSKSKSDQKGDQKSDSKQNDQTGDSKTDSKGGDDSKKSDSKGNEEGKKKSDSKSGQGKQDKSNNKTSGNQDTDQKGADGGAGQKSDDSSDGDSSTNSNNRSGNDQDGNKTDEIGDRPNQADKNEDSSANEMSPQSNGQGESTDDKPLDKNAHDGERFEKLDKMRRDAEKSKSNPNQKDDSGSDQNSDRDGKPENGGGKKSASDKKDDGKSSDTNSGDDSKGSERSKSDSGKSETKDGKTDGKSKVDDTKDSAKSDGKSGDEKDDRKSKDGKTSGKSDKTSDGSESGDSKSGKSEKGKKKQDSQSGSKNGKSNSSDKKNDGSKPKSKTDDGKSGSEGKDSEQNGNQEQGSQTRQDGKQQRSQSRPGNGQKNRGSQKGGPRPVREDQLTEEQKANLEYTKKVTDLALEYLDSQKENPDPELLKQMNWTQEEMNAFLKRYQEMKKNANSDSPLAKQDYTDKLRSLGLKDPQMRRLNDQVKSDSLSGLNEDGAVSKAPAEYAEEFNQFQKNRNRVRRGTGQK